MFGRMVKIDGKEFFVFCSPRTPLSEILYRASLQAQQQELADRAKDPHYISYQNAISDLSSGQV